MCVWGLKHSWGENPTPHYCLVHLQAPPPSSEPGHSSGSVWVWNGSWFLLWWQLGPQQFLLPQNYGKYIICACADFFGGRDLNPQKFIFKDFSFPPANLGIPQVCRKICFMSVWPWFTDLDIHRWGTHITIRYTDWLFKIMSPLSHCFQCVLFCDCWSGFLTMEFLCL